MNLNKKRIVVLIAFSKLLLSLLKSGSILNEDSRLLSRARAEWTGTKKSQSLTEVEKFPIECFNVGLRLERA